MYHVVYVSRDVLHDRVLRAHSNPPETVNGVTPILTGHVGDSLQLLLGLNDGSSRILSPRAASR